MITSGHWIVRRYPQDRTHPVAFHWETLAQAWDSIVPRDMYGLMTGVVHVPKTEPQAIISRCPAPGTEECAECWMAEVPF